MTTLTILLILTTAIASAALTLTIYTRRQLTQLEDQVAVLALRPDPATISDLADHVRRGHSGTKVTWVPSHPSGYEDQP